MSTGTAHEAGVRYLTSRVPGASTPPTVRWRGGYYQFDGVLYLPVTDEALEAQVTSWLTRNPGSRTDLTSNRVWPIDTRFVRDVMLAVRAHGQLPDATEPGAWLQGKPAGAVGPFLATRGGVLDLGQLAVGPAALLPAGPDFFALSALPVAPDPAASCPTWLSFLGATFCHGPGAVNLIQELFGYCLLPDCPFEKFFVFYGPANTGKSTVAEVLQGLLGAGNVSAVPLEQLGGQFALANLMGKLANVVFDGGEVTCAAEGTFKALVSGEPVEVNAKHRPVRTMRLAAKHVVLTNVLPAFSDTSDGVWRRLVLLPFERVCPPDQRDPALKQRLRSELPAIAHWAVRGLARLLQQGRFTAHEEGERLSAEHRRDCNPVALFLSEKSVPDHDGRVGRQELYARYRQWAEAGGMGRPPSKTKFNRAVAAIYPQGDGEVRDGRGGDRMFVGFRLDDSADIVRQFRVLDEGREERA
jgi:putative DNA primase/helicase